jgi:hypothetical protein
MSATTRLKLDFDGIREIANSEEMAAMVHEAGERIAHAAKKDTQSPVVVNDYTTDRKACAVTIADDDGLAMQARDGILTKAAGSIGVDVTEKQ